MFEIAANSVVASPTISASHSLTNGSYGFDLDADSLAMISTDSACWIQIDFGVIKNINKIRLKGGPNNPGSQAQTLLVSQDGTIWTTIASWAGQTYYTTLSPWFYVVNYVRYIRVTSSGPNYYYLYYMGVELIPQDNLRYRDRIRIVRLPNFNTSFLTCKRDRFQLFGVSSAPARHGQNVYGADILTGGTATASSTEGGSSPDNAVDNDTGTRWNNNNAMPSWWKYDLGAGVTGTPAVVRLYKISYDQLKNFILEGSNDDASWTTLTTGLVPMGLGVWNTYFFSNTTAYRYFRMSMADSWSGNWMSIGEIELCSLLA